MRWPGCSWQPIPVGHRGEHQLEPVEDMGILSSDTGYAKFRTTATTTSTSATPWRSMTCLRSTTATCLLSTLEPWNLETGNLDEPNSERAALLGGSAATDEAENHYGVPFPSRTSALEETDYHDTRHHVTINNGDNGNRYNDTAGNRNAIDNHNRDTTGNQDAIDNHNHEGQMNYIHSSEGDFTKNHLLGYKPGSLKPLTKGKLHTLILSATEANKRQQRLLKQGKQIHATQKLVWEVFAGKGQTSVEARRLGARVETFSKKTGWDFERAKVSGQVTRAGRDPSLSNVQALVTFAGAEPSCPPRTTSPTTSATTTRPRHHPELCGDGL